MSMEKELQDKYKISYAIAHECVVGAKKQLGISSDIEAEQQHDAVMAAADEIYKKLPVTTGEKPTPTDAKDPNQLNQGKDTATTCWCCANLCCCLEGQVS